MSSITVSDLQCRKENIHTLCSPYSPAFHTCTFEIPFTSSFPVYLAHPLLPTSPNSHPSLTGWGARDFSLLRRRSWEDVRAGGCNKLHAGSLCFDRLRWRILLLLEPDVVLADAVQASHAALAGLLPSHPRPPPLPAPLPSPPEPRPAPILSRESSPCQIAWWFSDVNRWD